MQPCSLQIATNLRILYYLSRILRTLQNLVLATSSPQYNFNKAILLTLAARSFSAPASYITNSSLEALSGITNEVGLIQARLEGSGYPSSSSSTPDTNAAREPVLWSVMRAVLRVFGVMSPMSTQSRDEVCCALRTDTCKYHPRAPGWLFLSKF